MEKTDKIKQISGNGDWSFGGRSGNKYEIVLENGDSGNYFQMGTDECKLKEGQEITYTINEKGTLKIATGYSKSASNGSKGSNGSFALSYAKDIVVAAIRADVSNASIDADEDVMKIADKFKKWLDEN